MFDSISRASLFIVAALVGAVGCSAGDPSDDDTEARNDAASAGEKPADEKGGSAKSAAPSAATCASKSNADACLTCCELADIQAFTKPKIAACMCAAATEKCSAACAEIVCSRADGSGLAANACTECIGIDESCAVEAEDACLADSSCSPRFSCVLDAKCLSKR